MSTPLPGLMQDDFPLTIHHIRRRMRTTRPDAKVVTLREPGVLQRATHAEVAKPGQSEPYATPWMVDRALRTQSTYDALSRRWPRVRAPLGKQAQGAHRR